MWRPVLLALCAGLPSIALADDGTLLGDDTWRYHSSGALAVDGGLVVGFPAALPTGMSTGVGLGITRGNTLTWGARAAWVTATESSLPWTVTHSDLRLRVTGGVQAMPGRGIIGLRLSLGGTLIPTADRVRLLVAWSSAAGGPARWTRRVTAAS